MLHRLPAPTRAAWTLALALVAFVACCKREPASHAGHSASDDEATVAAGGTLTVRVDGSGYHPARIRAAANSEITLSFLRTTDECCGQQVKIPSLSIQRELPLNQPVAVPVRVPASGQLGFTCGMDMYRGSVVVQ
jgi:plastocyanin domain-containing protein